MNPLTGYLPVWLNSEQESEYKHLLEEHHKVEYYEFEELASIEMVVPNYMHITVNISGRLVGAYSMKAVHAYSMKTVHTWVWDTKQVAPHHSLSLMKIE